MILEFSGIANKEGEEDYQPSSEQDESDNIDGIIEEDTYSVKPETFLQKNTDQPELQSQSIRHRLCCRVLV